MELLVGGQRKNSDEMRKEGRSVTERKRKMLNEKRNDRKWRERRN